MIQVAGYVNISISDPSKAFVSCLLSILWGENMIIELATCLGFQNGMKINNYTR